MDSCEQGSKFSGCVTKDQEYLEELRRSHQPLKMVSAPSGRQVTRDLYLRYNDKLLWRAGVLVQQFFMVAPNIYGPSVWNLLHGTLLVPRILRWLLRLGKFVHCWSRGKVLTCYIKCFDKFCFSTLSVTYKQEFGNKWFVKGSFNHVFKSLIWGKIRHSILSCLTYYDSALSVTGIWSHTLQLELQ